MVMLVTLYTSRIVLKELGIVDYGIYNVVAGFVAMFSFFSSSMANAIQRYLNFEFGKNNDKGGEKVYGTGFVLLFCVSLLMVFVLETLGLWFLNNKLVIPDERRTIVSMVYHIAVFTTFVTVNHAIFTACILAHEDMKVYAYTGVFQALARLITAFCLVISPIDRLIMYTSLFCITDVLLYLFYLLYCVRKYTECSFIPLFCKKTGKQLLFFIGWNTVISLSNTINNQGINILLNVFFGPIVNAARGIAFQIFNALQSFGFNIYSATRPQLVKSYASGNMDYFSKLFFQSSKVSYYLLFVICVPILVNIEFVLNIWLEKYPDNTVIFSKLIILCVLVESLSCPIWAAIQAVGRLKSFAVFGSLIFLLILPISFVLFSYGYPAYTVFIVYLIIRCLYLFATAKILSEHVVEIKIKRYCKDVISPILISSLLILSIIYSVNTCFSIFLITDFIMLSILYIIISLFVIYLFGINKTEKKGTMVVLNKLNLKIRKFFNV